METSDFAQEMSVTGGQRVIEKLATTGGTCDTYRVRINGKWHFMKRPREEMASNSLYITAFEREFDIGYRLEHKSLVRYIDKRSDEQGVYILTEMVDGDNLDEFVNKNPDYFKDKRKLKEFVMQMLEVLDYLHNNQVLHLDLKPSNIMITRVGHKVKLIDLGFAYSDCYQSIAAGMTREYAAPEQLNGGEVGPWTDIYALGKVLLALFNKGKHNNEFQSVPSWYRGFVKKCVEQDPKQRFATIAEAQRYLSKKHSIHSLIAGFVISIAILMIIILWSVNHGRNSEVSQSVKEIIAMPHDSIDSMVNRNSAREIGEINTSHSANYQASPQNNQNQDAIINTYNASPAIEKKVITVPEPLKSQLHERAKAAFAALERQYPVIDDYKTRSNLLIEIKKSRQEIFGYAKSQAHDNEGKEEYYNVALEILNEEYENSNLTKILDTSK